MGSWKIMLMRLPRMLRKPSSSSVSSSVPFILALPETLAFLGSNPISARVLTLLPLPLSPTIPRDSPRRRV